MNGCIRFILCTAHISKQPIEEMGQIATKILLENIDEKKEIVQMNTEATLIIRKSTLPVQSK